MFTSNADLYQNAQFRGEGATSQSWTSMYLETRLLKWSTELHMTWAEPYAHRMSLVCWKQHEPWEHSQHAALELEILLSLCSTNTVYSFHELKQPMSLLLSPRRTFTPSTHVYRQDNLFSMLKLIKSLPSSSCHSVTKQEWCINTGLVYQIPYAACLVLSFLTWITVLTSWHGNQIPISLHSYFLWIKWNSITSRIDHQ